MTALGSTANLGLICTLTGGEGAVSVIWYSAHKLFLLATASYLRNVRPGDRFSLIRLNFSDHPRISLIRQFSHRRPGMNVPPSLFFDLYASAISCFVGSSDGDWPKNELGVRRQQHETRCSQNGEFHGSILRDLESLGAVTLAPLASFLSRRHAAESKIGLPDSRCPKRDLE